MKVILSIAVIISLWNVQDRLQWEFPAAIQGFSVGTAMFLVALTMGP